MALLVLLMVPVVAFLWFEYILCTSEFVVLSWVHRLDFTCLGVFENNILMPYMVMDLVTFDVDVFASVIFSTVVGYVDRAAIVDVNWRGRDGGGNDGMELHHL